MFQDELQKRIHDGDQDAFRELYGKYSKKVFSLVNNALDDKDTARAAVKQIFLKVYRQILRDDTDLDLPAELSALTNEEIRIRRIAKGEISEEALQVQYIVTAQDDLETNDTMVKIRSRMIQDEAVRQQEEPEKTVKEEKQEVREEKQEIREEKTPEPESKEPISLLDNTADLRPDRKKKKKSGSVIATIVLTILILAFLWLIAGILMDPKIGVLPPVDLGYSYFNKNVFEFFRLS